MSRSHVSCATSVAPPAARATQDTLNDSELTEFRISCIVRAMVTIASDIDVLARFGRALADPIRCRILIALREAPAHPADLADLLGISRTRLSNHLACLRDCGLVVAVPVGRRTRYELADERLGHALDDLRTAVIAVAADRTCVNADEKGCC
jgi:DNA-binding transcriptional ArsR family regulator